MAYIPGPADQAAARVGIILEQGLFGIAAPSEAQVVAEVNYYDYFQTNGYFQNGFSVTPGAVAGTVALLQGFLTFPEVATLTPAQFA